VQADPRVLEFSRKLAMQAGNSDCIVTGQHNDEESNPVLVDKRHDSDYDSDDGLDWEDAAAAYAFSQ